MQLLARVFVSLPSSLGVCPLALFSTAPLRLPMAASTEPWQQWRNEQCLSCVQLCRHGPRHLERYPTCTFAHGLAECLVPIQGWPRCWREGKVAAWFGQVVAEPMRDLVREYVGMADERGPIPYRAFAQIWFYGSWPKDNIPRFMWEDSPGLSLPEARLWLTSREGFLPFESAPGLEAFLDTVGGGADLFRFVELRSWSFPMVSKRALMMGGPAEVPMTPPGLGGMPKEEPMTAGASSSGLAPAPTAAPPLAEEVPEPMLPRLAEGAVPEPVLAPPEPEPQLPAPTTMAFPTQPKEFVPVPMVVSSELGQTAPMPIEPAAGPTSSAMRWLGPDLRPMSSAMAWLGSVPALAEGREGGSSQGEGLCSASTGKAKKKHSAAYFVAGAPWGQPLESQAMPWEASAASTEEEVVGPMPESLTWC